MKIGTNRNQVSVCCAEDVIASASPDGDRISVYCSACKDDCEVEILSDSQLMDRHAEIAEKAEADRIWKTLFDASHHLRVDASLDASFDLDEDGILCVNLELADDRYAIMTVSEEEKRFRLRFAMTDDRWIPNNEGSWILGEMPLATDSYDLAEWMQKHAMSKSADVVREAEKAHLDKLNASIDTMKASAFILKANLLQAYFEDFEQTVAVEAYLPSGEVLYFLTGTINGCFETQWHSTTRNKSGTLTIEGDVHEPCYTGEEQLPLDVSPPKLARWIRHCVLATLNDVFEAKRRKANS